MKYSLEKLRRYGFNERELTENDFYEICRRENIKVLEAEVSRSFYMSFEGKSVIVLEKNLSGLRRCFTQFHELAHHFLHGGRGLTQAFFFGLLDDISELEADALALIALIPLRELKSYDFLDEHPNRYARKLYKDRQRLYFLYGI